MSTIDGVDCYSSDDETDLEVLFRSRNVDDEIFYFESISKCYDIPSNETTVTFHFNFANDVQIFSHLYLEGVISSDCDDIIRSIGMCVLCWFYMGFATKKLVIRRAVALNSAQIPFWLELYDNVLREFMFVHHLLWKLDIVFEESTTNELQNDIKFNEFLNTTKDSSTILLPLGGGKDSLVAWNLFMKSADVDATGNTCPNPALLYVTDTRYEYESNSKLQKLVEIIQSHHIGTKLHIVRHNFHCDDFESYAKSFCKPCGHPWAALVLFDALLVCKMNGIDKISFGHERSADEGNGVSVNGLEVNHQYDKSSQFITLASSFARDMLHIDVEITSAVSHLWEIEIARIFCEDETLKKCHSFFMSCNSPVQVGVGGCEWCAKCEKCCFIFLILSAWMSPSKVIEIFQGKNLFENFQLRKHFLALIGENCESRDSTIQKPFECVGTVLEAKCAIHLAVFQYMKEFPELRYCCSTRTCDNNIVERDFATCSDNVICDSSEPSAAFPVVMQLMVEKIETIGLQAISDSLEDFETVKDEILSLYKINK